MEAIAFPEVKYKIPSIRITSNREGRSSKGGSEYHVYKESIESVTMRSQTLRVRDSLAVVKVQTGGKGKLLKLLVSGKNGIPILGDVSNSRSLSRNELRRIRERSLIERTSIVNSKRNMHLRPKTIKECFYSF